MQYVFTMTSRMVTIAIGCAVLLCALLFLLGFEIGARFVAPHQADVASGSTSSAAALATDTTAIAPALPAASADNQMSGASLASPASSASDSSNY
ncbi:hypothetical protein [Paraburkholderia sp.]|uniref:hypothetical protein n=1 Tax=Paraburkholderia sp. TaxID=1926495 RepID=UPI00239D43EC|nr:hypothetical protein [Paraburkholderia sp.]MDE1180914.1 hypothetical protein [Paraburkholderia sp.]